MLDDSSSNFNTNSSTPSFLPPPYEHYLERSDDSISDLKKQNFGGSLDLVDDVQCLSSSSINGNEFVPRNEDDQIFCEETVVVTDDMVSQKPSIWHTLKRGNSSAPPPAPPSDYSIDKSGNSTVEQVDIVVENPVVQRGRVTLACFGCLAGLQMGLLFFAIALFYFAFFLFFLGMLTLVFYFLGLVFIAAALLVFIFAAFLLGIAICIQEFLKWQKYNTVNSMNELRTRMRGVNRRPR